MILLFQSGLDPEALIGAISMLTVGYSPLVSVCYTFRPVRFAGSFCQSEKNLMLSP